MASTYSAVEGALETRAVPVASGAPLAPPNVVSGAVSSVLALVGLSPFISDNPVAPVPSPAMWAMLAWVRRQSQQTLIDETPTVSQTPAQSSQTVDGVVTGNTELSAPVAVAVATAAVVADPPALVQVDAVTPQADQSAVATAAVVADPPALVQVDAVTPQTDQSAVATAAVVADPPALVQVDAVTPQAESICGRHCCRRCRPAGVGAGGCGDAASRVNLRSPLLPSLRYRKPVNLRSPLLPSLQTRRRLFR